MRFVIQPEKRTVAAGPSSLKLRRSTPVFAWRAAPRHAYNFDKLGQGRQADAGGRQAMPEAGKPCQLKPENDNSRQ